MSVRMDGMGETAIAPRRRWVLVSALVVSLGFGVAACGGDDDGKGGGTGGETSTSAPAKGGLDDLSAQEILDKAKEAAKKAGSAHVEGEVSSGGQNVSFDLTFAGEGKTKGTIGIGGTNLEIIQADGSVFVKAPAEFFEQFAPGNGAAIGQLLGDKYLKIDASSPQASSFNQFTKFDEFVDGVLSPNGTIKKVDGKDVDGTATVGLESDDKENGGTLYVANEGEPYPLLIEAPENSDDKGSLKLSDWGKKVDIEAPGDDEAIDVTKLAAAGGGTSTTP